MTSNTKMVLFFAAATVFNIVLMGILVLAFGAVAFLIHAEPWTQIIIFGGLIGSIVLTFLAYSAIVKWATARFDLPKHIPQLFKSRKK